MIEFVFQNSSLVVVDKPAGVLSVPPRFPDERRILGRELETQLGTQIFPVHRLDYEVSGLIIFATNSVAHKILNRAFENSEIQKTYQALTSTEKLEGPWTKASASTEAGAGVQTWKSQIERGKKRSFQSPRGLGALTEATCLGAREIEGVRRLVWSLKPLTGRPHQLRFELAQRGYPILGDALYGSKDVWKAENEIALRAVKLELPKLIQEELAMPAEINAKAFDF